jgi:hypothetical protein
VTKLKRRRYGGTTATGTDSFTWVQDGAGRWYIGTAMSLTGTFTKKTSQALDVYGNVVTTQVYKPTDHNGDGSAAARCGLRCEFPVPRECDDDSGLGSVRELFGGHGGEPDGDVDERSGERGGVPGGDELRGAGGVDGERVEQLDAMGRGAAPNAEHGGERGGERDGLRHWPEAVRNTEHSCGQVGPFRRNSTAGRPSSSTAATGASTGYTYSTAAPWTVTATVNGRWTDAGRISAGGEGGVGARGGPVSVTETEYRPAARWNLRCWWGQVVREEEQDSRARVRRQGR